MEQLGTLNLSDLFQLLRIRNQTVEDVRNLLKMKL